MPDHDTLCGWGLKEKVAYFLEKADIIIPRRREQLDFLIDLFPWPCEEPIRVLDLGCGFGAITEEILGKYPHASVTSVDGSEEMMKLARERLAKYGDRVRLHFADLADPSWHRDVTGPFHAAVSAVAIHHLVDDRKRELYREIYDLVDHGGIFLNDEAVASPPGFKARFEEMHYRAIQEQERAKYGVARPVEELSKNCVRRWRRRCVSPATIAMSRPCLPSSHGFRRRGSNRSTAFGNTSGWRFSAA